MFAKYRNVVSLTYGWNVELVCSHCKTSVMPRYEGRSPHMATGAGDATTFAKLACPACGQRLIDEPVRKLAHLFADVRYLHRTTGSSRSSLPVWSSYP